VSRNDAVEQKSYRFAGRKHHTAYRHHTVEQTYREEEIIPVGKHHTVRHPTYR
jgi:hypothetical protein